MFIAPLRTPAFQFPGSPRRSLTSSTAVSGSCQIFLEKRLLVYVYFLPSFVAEFLTFFPFHLINKFLFKANQHIHQHQVSIFRILFAVFISKCFEFFAWHCAACFHRNRQPHAESTLCLVSHTMMFGRRQTPDKIFVMISDLPASKLAIYVRVLSIRTGQIAKKCLPKVCA